MSLLRLAVRPPMQVADSVWHLQAGALGHWGTGGHTAHTCPRVQGLISEMDRVKGMPAHEVVMEVRIRACFAGAALHWAFPFHVHTGPVGDAGPGLM